MEIYRKDPRKPRFCIRFCKGVETLLRAVAILIKATVLTIPIWALWWALWHFVFHDIGMSFPSELKGIAFALIGLCIALYVILASETYSRAFGKYEKIRFAISGGDKKTFMQLRNEDTSPLGHTLTNYVAFITLLGFVLFPYPSFLWGFVFVSTASYTFTLVWVVIGEVDTPFGGFWVIKNVPEKWAEEDPKKWLSENVHLVNPSEEEVVPNEETDTDTEN